MGDRRSFFSRFLSARGNRRAPETKTSAPPSKTTDSTPKTTRAADESELEPEPVSETNHTSEIPLINDTKTPEKQSTTTGSSPTPEPRKSPSRGEQMATHTTNTTTISLDEPKTSSPSGATKSPSSSKPASPYRRTTTQSRSPPQPSSQSNTPTQTTSASKKTSQPPSPSRLPPRSPKQRPSSSPKETQPTSPSKESKPPTQETKDVKEVVAAMNTEANEETKKEVNEFLIPKSGSEAQVNKKADVPSESDQMHGEKQEALDTKEVVATSPPSVTLANTTTSQPKNGSTVSGPRDISALPSGKRVTFHRTSKADTKKAIHNKHASVITLAGENTGSLMQMEANASEREKPFYILRNYKINPHESGEAATDEGRSSEVKNSEDAKSTEDQPKEAYVNNNSQGVNNSIVFNSSITEGNPGVHMVITHVPKELIQSGEEKRSPETRKAEFDTTHSERRTYGNE